MWCHHFNLLLVYYWEKRSFWERQNLRSSKNLRRRRKFFQKHKDLPESCFLHKKFWFTQALQVLVSGKKQSRLLVSRQAHYVISKILSRLSARELSFSTLRKFSKKCKLKKVYKIGIWNISHLSKKLRVWCFEGMQYLF